MLIHSSINLYCPTDLTLAANADHQHHVWIATARLMQTNRHSQRQAVRQLLRELMRQLCFDDVLLDTADYPLRLARSGHFVCFSHSEDQVALAMAPRQIGIDIERREIAWQVAQRFFHHNELTWLHQLSTAERTMMCRWAWQLKEALIKMTHTSLLHGMNRDVSQSLQAIYTALGTEQTHHLIGSSLGSLAPYAPNATDTHLHLHTRERILLVF